MTFYLIIAAIMMATSYCGAYTKLYQTMLRKYLTFISQKGWGQFIAGMSITGAFSTAYEITLIYCIYQAFNPLFGLWPVVAAVLIHWGIYVFISWKHFGTYYDIGFEAGQRIKANKTNNDHSRPGEVPFPGTPNPQPEPSNAVAIPIDQKEDEDVEMGQFSLSISYNGIVNIVMPREVVEGALAKDPGPNFTVYIPWQTFENAAEEARENGATPKPVTNADIQAHHKALEDMR